MVKKIKVLHIILELGPGGVEKFLVDFMLNYDKEKFDISVVSLLPREDSIFEKILDDNKVDVTYLNMTPWIYDIRVLFQLNKIIKEKKPDILHVHLFMTRFTFLPAILNKVPVKIHTVHIPANKEASGIFRFIQSIAYKKGKFIPIAISKSVEESIKVNHHIENTKLIYNGIDLKKFNVHHEIDGDKNNSECINIINVARFMPEKNQKLLIDVLYILSKRYTNIKLRLVGNGKTKNEILRKVNKLGLEDKVEFLGARNDIPELLNKSDIFLLSSNYEGFCLVIVEAMACGLPVVATNVGAIPEIIKDRENGLLVKPNDPDEFAKAIIEIIENKDMRKMISSNAINDAKKYNFENTVKKYEDLYLSELKSTAEERTLCQTN